MVTASKPRVSVAIATFNRAGMVAEAIDAILEQSRPPDEIVVADDASTDATWAVLENFAARDSRVRPFRQSRNSGGVENWNFALAQTCGDLIAWCSDDDRFLPGHLQASVEYLEAHPEIGLVHSGFVDVIEIDGARETAPRPLRAARALIMRRANLPAYMTRYYDWPFHPSTIVMRREVWIQTGGFDPRYALADTDWFVRAAGRFPAALLPRHGVLNRRHRGNWSNRIGSAEMQREIFEIVEKAMDRQWPRWSPAKTLWRAAWRANARLRLALTLRARLRSGHGEAARALWHGLSQNTGRRAPKWIERAGESVIASLAGRRKPVVREARESVSPL